MIFLDIEVVPPLITELIKIAKTPEEILSMHQTKLYYLMISNKSSEALAEVEKILAIDPNSNATLLNKAILLKELGDATTAEGIAKEVLSRLKGHDLVNEYYRASAYAILNDTKELKHSLKTLKTNNHFFAALIFYGDPEFASYRADPEFSEFLYKPPSATQSKTDKPSKSRGNI